MHSIRRPLRGQRRLGVPVFLASTSLLPVELRPQKSSLEHQQSRIVMSTAPRKSFIRSNRVTFFYVKNALEADRTCSWRYDFARDLKFPTAPLRQAIARKKLLNLPAH